MSDPTTVPDPPVYLGDAGRALWQAILADYEFEPHEMRLLVDLCCCVDVVERLEAEVRDRPVVDDGRLNPAVSEARLQRGLLAKLAGGLRIPVGEVEQTPQRRLGPRGVYQTGGR